MSALVSVEAALTGAGYLSIPASPLQLAVARLADGGRQVADLLAPEECRQYLGTAEPDCSRPTLNVLVCGVRGGKSTLAEAGCISAVFSADLSPLKPWQTARFVIVGPTVDAADATFNELVGAFQNSAHLRSRIVGTPKAGRLVVKRPDGRKVEIAVVAATAGGASVRNRWLCGFVLEEAAQIGAEQDGKAVNVEEILRAARTRLLPGCQGWVISSPWGPSGELWRLYKAHFGKAGQVRVVHAPTRALNPSFPQATIDAIAAENPDVAAREYGAEWLDPDSNFFVGSLVDDARRADPLRRPPLAGLTPVAAIDPGLRANSWTRSGAWGEVPATGVRVVVAGCWEWTGSRSKPLQPKTVFAEIAGIVAPYGITTICSDNYSFDALAGHATDAGLELREIPFGQREAAYGRTKALLGNAALELPPGPEHVRADLLAVRQRVTSSGVRIVLPLTPDGRHCDFAPSVTLAVAQAEQTARRPQTIDWDFMDELAGIAGQSLGGSYSGWGTT